MKIVALVPAHNEQDTIEQVVSTLRAQTASVDRIIRYHAVNIEERTSP